MQWYRLWESIQGIFFLLIPIVFFSILLGLWNSVVGGWGKLAQVYRADKPFYGRIWHMQYAEMRRLVRYPWCMNIGVSDTGLYLSVIVWCRVGHPSLFIPWSDITISEQRYRWREIRFSKVPQAPIWVWGIRRALSEELERASRGNGFIAAESA